LCGNKKFNNQQFNLTNPTLPRAVNYGALFQSTIHSTIHYKKVMQVP